ncbi:hypothetical protein CY34DRAFT_774036 [Suillus luteus UH-Slu-Lm8-n1]|uniref:Uncharacterized protein n=1 Tax=Suillus luteus UH-Slu-Lm8-n1 TaxID=930992 RepID=A0A0D0AUB5_9AGAM|nr:hypothetical protein CY34DRAFT_774036 [Suillus luteus UH-Slu-Lm8-n1]
MSLSFEQFPSEDVQRLKFQISSSTQESQIDIKCPPPEGRERHYGYRITQDFILAFENEIKKFIDPADFYDPTCVSLTRNWLLKELRLRQLDYKCCVDSVLVPEDSGDEGSEGEVEGIVDEREDDAKTDEHEGGPIDHEDAKDDDTKTDEQESNHYGDEEGDAGHYEDEKYDDEGDTIHYEDEKDDDTKTDEEESTHYEDGKEDNPRTDEDQGDASPYEDEKDDGIKADEHEAFTNDHHEDAKEDEDEGYTSHHDEDDEFEVEYDAEEMVVVVISVCSNDPVSFQARPTQAQMDMMATLLSQPPQWWFASLKMAKLGASESWLETQIYVATASFPICSQLQTWYRPYVGMLETTKGRNTQTEKYE